MMANSPYQKKDEQLFAEIQKLKNGDSSNINAVYELSEKYIYKIINDIVKNHHTTEDLMQDAYIQIYNKIDTLQEVKAFYVWAGRIATNLTLRYIQKNSKEVLATPDEEGETNFIFDTAAADNEKFIPESVLVDREKQRLIAEIIDNLSTEQKICIQYFYYEEMSVNEIAEAMGCSAGTIKSRLNYARKSIKEAVVELDEKHGTRLYSLASAPLFLIVFRAMAEGLLPAAVGAVSAVSVGGASASVTGGAGASVTGSAGVSVTGGAGVSAAGGAATDGVSSASTVSAAAKTVSAVEKDASASRVEAVKNIALKKLKKAGTDLKTDAKKVAKAAKEMGKTNREAIKAAFETGKKEGFKQILKSTGNILGTTVKGFGASTLATKVVTVTVAGTLVATPIINGGGTGGNKNAEFDMYFTVFYADNGIFYEQYPDQIEGDNYPLLGSYYAFDDNDTGKDIWICLDKDGTSSDSTALSENSLQELISYGLQFKDCKGEFDEYGTYRYTESVNNEIVIDYNGKNCTCFIDEVSVATYNGNESEETLYKTAHTIHLSGTISSTNSKKIGKTSDSPMAEQDIIMDKTPDLPARDLGTEETDKDVVEDTDSPIDITDSKYATTHPGAAGIADPSEMEGFTVPELETTLPTVKPVSDMETLQAILYEKYALFDNVTDEIVYERMSAVPCTVYLDDGSVHSVTLAECMFRDWSGYADVDKIEYDEDLAQEILSSYTKWTDSLID